jgi:hypothetical protein
VCIGSLMMRRFATIFIVLALVLGGGVTSCLAAIASAGAMECCSKDCPQRSAHNSDRCCSVGGAAQNGEVAPALPLTSADSSLFSLAMVPVSAIFAPPGSSHLAIHVADWSPPPRLLRSALCTLQI